MAKNATKIFTYDLETTFLSKGFKRPDTLILEIGVYSKEDEYQTLINPLQNYNSGEEVINSLTTQSQHAEKTLNFWTKLLIGKKMLNSSVKRKSMEDKADIISQMLVKNDNDTFKPPLTALNEALNIAPACTWIAHNGTAFDSKIIKGNADRLRLDYSHIHFLDSLPLLRHTIKDLPSYSQPIVYHHLFKSKYHAHHALDDAVALYKILIKLFDEPEGIRKAFQDMPVSRKTKRKPQATKKTDSDLYELPSVGAKSVEFLEKKGIKSKAELDTWVKTHTKETWLKEMKGLHRYKKLANTLF